ELPLECSHHRPTWIAPNPHSSWSCATSPRAHRAARPPTCPKRHRQQTPPTTRELRTGKAERVTRWVTLSEEMFGGDLLSHTVSHAVPSAQKGLASGFGMEPGV